MNTCFSGVLAALLPALLAQEPFRLVPHEPQAATPTGPAWFESFAAAAAAAKQRHTNLLLYFTATW